MAKKIKILFLFMAALTMISVCRTNEISAKDIYLPDYAPYIDFLNPDQRGISRSAIIFCIRKINMLKQEKGRKQACEYLDRELARLKKELRDQANEKNDPPAEKLLNRIFEIKVLDLSGILALAPTANKEWVMAAEKKYEELKYFWEFLLSSLKHSDNPEIIKLKKLYSAEIRSLP